MKRYEVLAKALSAFEDMEEYEQLCMVDYIDCPSEPNCRYREEGEDACRQCKIKWLTSEWQA